jgi:hypothetical protein
LSYNEIGDKGAIAISRLFEEHDDMQNRLDLWNNAKRKRIELSQELNARAQEASVPFISSAFRLSPVDLLFTFECS